MKGDYTLRCLGYRRRYDEDHPQMKGDYTHLVGDRVRRADEDHPQMKGDYTRPPILVPFPPTKTTPK